MSCISYYASKNNTKINILLIIKVLINVSMLIKVFIEFYAKNCCVNFIAIIYANFMDGSFSLLKKNDCIEITQKTKQSLLKKVDRK